MNQAAPSGNFNIRSYLWITAIAWTAVVAGLIVWDIYGIHGITRELAINDARAHFNKDQAFRLWATSHGTLYVPVGPRMQPNPNLAQIPERDIQTPSGRQLTIINPAEIIRQMNENFSELYGVAGRITSFKVLRQENAPDTWELAALNAFRKGLPEALEFTEMNGAPYLRVMRPMLAQASCLPCHAQQDFEIDKVSGGVGVAVPLAPFLARERMEIRKQIFSHGFLWLLGLIGIGLGGRRLERYDQERRHSEQGLRASEIRKAAILEYALDCIITVDEQGRIIEFNPAAEQTFGFFRDQILGKKLVETIIPPDLRAAHERGWERYLKTGQPKALGRRFETRAKRADGRELPIEIGITRIPQEGPQIFTAYVRDISEHKQAQDELQRLNEHIRLLLDSTGEGVMGIDMQGRCTFINQSALSMLGYERDEIIGKNTHELIHRHKHDGTDYPPDFCPLQDTINDGETYHISEEILWRKDNSYFPVDYSSYPLREQNRLKGAVVVFRDITEAQAMARELSYQAMHDALTGLINRYEFERRLQKAMTSAKQGGAIHVLLYLDLDQFKIVNDTCGHTAGDELLRQLSSILQSKMRVSDSLARLGGDEFGILLENCPLQQAGTIAEQLRAAVHDFRFTWDNKTFMVGASIGVVPITTISQSGVGLLSEADAACYMAKDSGGNRVHVFQPDDAEIARRHGEMQWVSSLHEAIANDRFQLFYQTIVPITAGSDDKKHYEILLRLNDDNDNIIPPGMFLPAAERFKLAPDIDRWVIKNVFAWLDAHPSHLEQLEMCAINLSGYSVSNEAFLDYVTHLLRDSRVPPHKICFEITETAAIANLAKAVAFINALKQLGCRFALDDFGSGMSSFTYLKNLPVDFVKIDGTFVKGIIYDESDFAMVKSINDIGHVLGKQTIAEFVDSPHILEKLGEIGVDYAQGYAICLPHPLAHILKS